MTIRVAGVLASGKTSEVDFRKIFEAANDACFVMKNTYKLTTKELEEVKVEEGSVEEIEENVVAEHLGQFEGITVEREKKLIELLIPAFDKEKVEGELKATFEERIVKDVFKILEVESEA